MGIGSVFKSRKQVSEQAANADGNSSKPRVIRLNAMWQKFYSMSFLLFLSYFFANGIENGLKRIKVEVRCPSVKADE